MKTRRAVGGSRKGIMVSSGFEAAGSSHRFFARTGLPSSVVAAWGSSSSCCGCMWCAAWTQNELGEVEKSLSRVAPLVFAGECRQLHEHLGKSMAEME